MAGQHVEADGAQALLEQIPLGLQIPAEASVPLLLVVEAMGHGTLQIRRRCENQELMGFRDDPEQLR